MRRRALSALTALSVLTTIMLAGCGGGLTAAQLRSQATQVCDRAADQTASIRLPETPSGGQRFLAQGIAVLGPEIHALRNLGGRGSIATAVAAMQTELAALRSSLKGLRAGNDPVVAVKTLQQQLLGREQRANRAWRALRVPACVSR
ncbi:MAG: hypothetical protein M3022_02120 [Actinomycetota bacterium]|nr:hypothetical protein [Actinomycetota bacterium]